MATRGDLFPDLLSVEDFQGAVDANTPLFNRDPGWLKTCQNLRPRPGGFLEAIGGYEALKPSGGTSAPVDSQGIIVGFHEHIQTKGCAMWGVNETTFGPDVSRFGAYKLFGVATDLVTMPPVMGVADTTRALYFGSVGTFSRLEFNGVSGTGGGSTYSVTWQYWNGTAWTSFPSPAPTEDFKLGSLVTKVVSWSVPSDWAPKSVNNIYLYWVRCQVTTGGVAASDSWGSKSAILADWPGRRILFSASSAKELGPSNGKLRSYGQTTAGVVTWSDAFAGANTLFSGNNSRYRFASFQDRLMFVNGQEQKRFNGRTATDIGLAPPTAPALTITPTVAVPNFGQACTFDYAILYGYGPNGSWGRSNHVMSTTGPTVFAANQGAQLNWVAGGANYGEVDVVEVYRTDDLTGVPVSARGNVPMHRVAVIQNPGATGWPIAFYDKTYAFPFPALDLDIVINTPPGKCRFIKEFKERIVLAANNEYPARVWPSKPFEGEAFNTDLDDGLWFDFSHSGAFLTGMEPAFDTIFCWTENGMFGVSDLDEDIPNVFEVPGGVGCIAPDAAKFKYGVLIWPSHDGLYMMDQTLQVKRFTNDQNATFSRMSFETHGGSWAQMYDSMCEIHLLAPNGTPVSGAKHYRYDLQTGKFHEISRTLSPVAVVTAPLGHADQGFLHPIYANADPSVADRTPYVGEYLTSEAGAAFDCIADIHFGPRGFRKFSPKRAALYYMADAGWGNPTIGNPPGHTAIFKTPTGFSTETPKVGTDYKVQHADCTESSSGAQDIVLRFKATTVPGSGINRNQRIIAAYLQGKNLAIPPTA